MQSVLSIFAVAIAFSAPAAMAETPSVKGATKIGFVAGAGGFQKMAVTNQAFFDGLAEQGYIAGKNLEVVFRTAEGDMSRMPALVDEVLKNDVEILVVSSSPGCAAAKAATSAIPVLCISVQDDPSKAGLVASLPRAVGNVVGVYSYLPTGIAQQMDWLRTFVPKLRSVAVLYNPSNATHLRLLDEWRGVAGQHGERVVAMPVTRAADLDAAIALAQKDAAQIGIGLLGADTYAIRQDIAASALQHRFPIVMDTPGGYTEFGGVATVGVDIVPYYRRGALELMVPLLRGTRPDELSWIGPERVDVKINRDVARAFGLETASALP